MEQNSFNYADVETLDFGGQNQIVNQQEQNTQVNPSSFNEVDHIDDMKGDQKSENSESQDKPNDSSENQKTDNPKKSGKLKERL
jgi:hypothetical protein